MRGYKMQNAVQCFEKLRLHSLYSPLNALQKGFFRLTDSLSAFNSDNGKVI